MDDWQLLQDYVERDSDTAFRTLVNRYVNLVYSVALRQVRDAHLAEEVAQAVFILLARKARSFRQSIVLSGWLFRTTRFVASRAVRAEQRRQRREQEAFSMQQFTTPDDTWKRISPALDEALEHLGETDRNALLLRFFNDKSHRETAAALGVSEDAAKKRVTRALDKLRDFFAGRGVTLSATLLASTVAANAARAASPEISTSLTAKIIAGVSATAGALPPLVTQTLSAWRWAKLKLAGALAATVTAVVLVGIALVLHKPTALSTVTGNKGSSPPVTDTHPVASAFQARQSARAANPSRQVLHLKLRAKDTDEPTANAQLAISTVANGEWKQRFDVLTDETGSADVSYPANTMRLDIGVLSSGWAARFATWRTDQDPTIPPDYTLRVDRVTQSMGGWLRDEQGQPVADAEVEMQFIHNDMAQSETPRERTGFVRPAIVARSDQNGWWACAVLDPKADSFPSLMVRHPDFAPTDVALRQQAGDTSNVQRERMKLLWAGKLVTTMARGLTLIGTVHDETGQPIAGAQVAHEPASHRPIETKTSDDGLFAFQGLAAGDFDFIVNAPGFAQAYRKVSVSNGIAPMDVQFKPGGLLRLRVVDEQDDAVPDAVAALTGAFGGYAPEGFWSAGSGTDGRIEWTSAPREQALSICASKPGWLMTRGITVKADGEEHVIKLKQGLLVTGRIVDAETGQPILGAKSFPGYGLEDYCWYRGDTWRSTNETFQVRFTEEKLPWRVRVEAEGYEAFVSDALPLDFNSSLELDVALRRPDLSKAVRGVVLRPDGRPAIGAEIALLTLGHGAYLGRARFAHREVNDKLITNADGEGRFQFEKDPDSDKAHTAIALCEWGCARVLLQQLTEPLTIQLEPWGRVEGTVDSSARRRPVDSLFMQVQGPPGKPGTLQLSSDFYLRPFEGDDFVFEFVPPGDFYLALSAGAGVPYPEHHRTWLTVNAGETVKILVAKRGHRLKGRLFPTEGEGDWTKQGSVPTHEELLPGMRVHSRQYLAGNFARLVPLARELSPEENASYNYPTSWETSLTPLQHNHSPGVRMDTILALAVDGSFESLEGVLPGDYNLQVSINGRNSEQQTITVPEGTPSTIDLGNIMVNTNRPVTGRVVRSGGAAKTKPEQ